MTFVPLKLKEDVRISKIVTIHYFEYMSDFSYPGESHNFWEFLCVDKGAVNLIAGKTPYSLKKNNIIFHKPNEFHNVIANGTIAPNLVVIAFICNSPCMRFFENRILNITEKERTLIAQILQEARVCISSNLDDPYLVEMKRKPGNHFASEQLIKIYMEELLLHMIRRHTTPALSTPPIQSIKKKNDSLLYQRIVTYLENHIYEPLTMDVICRDNLVGRSQIGSLFRKYHNAGVMKHFSNMKISQAKVLIREQHMNFTQISNLLGYASVHYFSRQFKKTTGMSPSEYSYSIKVLSERPT